VTVTVTRTTKVAADGGVFSYGDAAFSGSMDGQPLNKPIAGMATTRKGNGYYELASDGGMFSFPTGAAGPPFYGSSGSMKLNKPVIGMSVHRGAGATTWARRTGASSAMAPPHSRIARRSDPQRADRRGIAG
jgi:hypothetical protein